MNYREIGRTGLTVSEIGFGGWGIGGSRNGFPAYGPVDDTQSLRTLRQALDAGITLYETSDSYGCGHSEELIGRAFAGSRSQVVIATKVGMISPEDDQDFSPSHIRRSVEASLRRLQSDHIDLYQLHNPPVDRMAPDDPAIVEMRQLQHEGKIRVFGISLRTPAEAVAAIVKLGAECVQVNLSLIDQRSIDNGLMDVCAAHGSGLIARTPLCYGFLTGRLDDRATFGAGDHRLRWPQAQLKRWSQAPADFEQIRSLDRQSHAQFALRFCLSYPAVTSVIAGMLMPEEVDENVTASDLGPLTDAQRAAAEAIYREREYFVRA